MSASRPATELLVDPVAAAHRLLGATIVARGVSAVVVEVEAYGGTPDGPWPDAAAHSYRFLAPMVGSEQAATIVAGEFGAATAPPRQEVAFGVGLEVDKGPRRPPHPGARCSMCL